MVPGGEALLFRRSAYATSLKGAKFLQDGIGLRAKSPRRVVEPLRSIAIANTLGAAFENPKPSDRALTGGSLMVWSRIRAASCLASACARVRVPGRKILAALAALISVAASAQVVVSETGLPHYSLPISAPPGISGMSPNLGFHYGGGGLNGPLGVGWSIQGISQSPDVRRRGPSMATWLGSPTREMTSSVWTDSA